MTVKTSSLPKWFHKHICEMMSSLKRCFPSILWGAECFLNCLSSARLDHADFCDFFFEEMKHLGNLDPKLFNQHLDVFHPSGEILAFILWWTVSKITCWKYSAFFFPSASHLTPIPFSKCGKILMRTHVFSSDNIWMGLHRAWTKPHKVSGKIPVVSVVFEWSC